ncbi:MAG: GMC family oxidoreductase [Shimia sp.]|uniref:FAD-dependent oxidoreductase n=1 Tax=Shimia sp. TaxID=1954381 RepID=UPI0025E76B55|nr:GMC family oxidoreductase [Shimia sp.]MCH2069570.1 GMC family oxidoreductase [Shimia sp.]
MSQPADIVIIGSGMGGATIAAALAPSGRRIVILERGEALSDTPAARDDIAIFRDGVFRPEETWLDEDNQPFSPGNYYVVGGNSKFYGAVLLRYRAEDFQEMQHLGGVSPAWPISYDELEPWYQKAEELFEVSGDASQDPSEPKHSGSYPHAPIADEASISDVRGYLKRAGVTPLSLPLGIDVGAWSKRAATPWDAYPDTTGAKHDAQTISLTKALQIPNLTLVTGCLVQGLEAGRDGRISKVTYLQGGVAKSVSPKQVILAAGAANSAALLLQSANENHPTGLANRSDMVGRNFMNHNCTAVLAIHPFRRNTSVYQKTLQLNDFYLSGGPQDSPLGNVQLMGRISGNILAVQSGLPLWMVKLVARRSVDWYVMSEDLPQFDSCVTVTNGKIKLDWKRTNWRTHEALVKRAKTVFRKAEYPMVLSCAFDHCIPSHQCGTARFGIDPMQTVLDLHCRAHDHPNFFVMDSSFLPTSAAVNPALTIAAQALRVCDHINQERKAA